MNTQEMREIATLDQAWAEAEEFRDVFSQLEVLPELSLLVALAHQPEALRVVRKALALVGLECERRARGRVE